MAASTDANVESLERAEVGLVTSDILPQIAPRLQILPALEFLTAATLGLNDTGIDGKRSAAAVDNRGLSSIVHN